jgi:hypothetical protein
MHIVQSRRVDKLTKRSAELESLAEQKRNTKAEKLANSPLSPETEALRYYARHPGQALADFARGATGIPGEAREAADWVADKHIQNLAARASKAHEQAKKNFNFLDDNKHLPDTDAKDMDKVAGRALRHSARANRLDVMAQGKAALLAERRQKRANKHAKQTPVADSDIEDPTIATSQEEPATATPLTLEQEQAEKEELMRLFEVAEASKDKQEDEANGMKQRLESDPELKGVYQLAWGALTAEGSPQVMDWKRINAAAIRSGMSSEVIEMLYLQRVREIMAEALALAEEHLAAKNTKPQSA